MSTLLKGGIRAPFSKVAPQDVDLKQINQRRGIFKVYKTHIMYTRTTKLNG